MAQLSDADMRNLLDTLELWRRLTRRPIATKDLLQEFLQFCEQHGLAVVPQEKS